MGIKSKFIASSFRCFSKDGSVCYQMRLCTRTNQYWAVKAINGEGSIMRKGKWSLSMYDYQTDRFSIDEFPPLGEPTTPWFAMSYQKKNNRHFWISWDRFKNVWCVFFSSPSLAPIPVDTLQQAFLIAELHCL